ncbi:unnamed protein product [Candidula unifasciata]|uniref:palmitoyl-protein hydrolase n=1 Tax=Candidula unifasciata TaxID=100452 RepID=A0A8S4A0J7_9EUPU|nr:unnamed protein product [Candidula unifasciata]
MYISLYHNDLCAFYIEGQLFCSATYGMNPPVIVQPRAVATASLIFLHGLGDSGHGWADSFRALALKHIRCICPHAVYTRITLNCATAVSVFDILGLHPSSPEDDQGIQESSKELQQLVHKEVSGGIPAEKIVIGGFSQGGALALYTALATDTPVGGVLGLSTWLPLNKYFTEDTNPKYNTNVPVLLCHGEADPMVSFRWGQATYEIVRSFNPNTQFKSYSNLSHSSCSQEMRDVKLFLEEVLKQ